MADISKIVLPNGTQYDIKDVTARSGLVDKVDKVSGKGLSTNDYTTDEKNKLAGVATGAEANVQSDWDETDSSSDAFIKNKPTISEDDGLDARLNGDTEITTNTDLNDYITPGEYYCHISPQERNITNYPINLAFRLRVEYSFNSNVSLGDMRQTFIPYNRSYYYVRTREFVNSAYKWNDWEKLSPTDNNFTTTLKDKLSGIADGAEVNVQADWNVTDTSSDAYIKNKPTIPTDTRNTFYGECATAAATAAKVVTVSSDQNFALKAGVMIGIKFTNTNTAENVTFNVNGTGAKDIWYNDYAYTGSSNNITGYAGRLLFYMYDGTHWCIVNKGWTDNNTWTANSSTAAGYVAASGTTAGKAWCSTTSNPAWTAIPTGVKGNSETSYRTGNVNLTAANIGAAPTSHASSATTYGQGNASNYGHVKLSNTYTSAVSGGNAAGGIAASQNALYNAYSTNKDRIDKLFDTNYSNDGANVTTSHNTLKNIMSFTAYAGEKSLIQISVQWATNATGFREVCVATGATSGAMSRYYASRIAAASGATTNQMLWCIINQGSSNQQLYVNVRQFSGGDLNVAYWGVKRYNLNGL